MRQFSTEMVLAAAAPLLFTPLSLRALQGHPLAPFPVSYEHILAAAEPSTAYAFLLRFLGPWSEFGIMLSVALGILSLYILDRILPLRAPQRALVLLTVAVNPVFISTFISLSPLPVALVLGLAMFLALQRGMYGLLPLLGVGVVLFSPIIGLFFILLCVVCAHESRARRVVLSTAAAMLLLFVFAEQILVFSFGHKLAFVEFGAANGISLFFLLLALIEVALSWRLHRVQGLFFFSLFLFAPFFTDAFMLLGLLSGLFAGMLFVRLSERQWVLGVARNLTLLVIACTFLFLIITHAAAVAHAPPTASLAATLTQLPADDGRVLTPEAYAVFVRAFTSHEPLVLPDVSRLYAMYRLAPAEEFLQRHNITYLLITREMREGLVWGHDDEGLLRLLATDAFTLVARTPEEELWRYNGATAS